jgi:ATP-binding cassette subfamily F protein uup
MAPPLLQLRDIHLTFGGKPLLEGAELSVAPGERLALVGRNGAGKSTFLKIAAGLVEPDRGERFLQPSVTVRYLPQEPDLSGHETILSFVEAGLAPGDDPHRARYLLETLGLTGEEGTARLSGGERRRAALARVLAPEPDILLLDEPTNHLDIAAIESLEASLKASRSAIVLISHDRRFLENLSRATVWLDRGIARRLDQGFGAFEAWRDQVFEEEEREQHKLDRKIVNEEHWVRYGVTARRKRNVRRMAELRDLRAERRRNAQNRRAGNVKLTVQEARASGQEIVVAKDIAKSFGDRAIVRDFSLTIERGDRIGFVGPNGAGKTTLLGLLTGTLAPDGGTIKLGTNLELATLDQTRASLNPEATVADTLTDGRGDTVIVAGVARHVVGYMKDFLFTPEQTRAPVKALSGGERGRLVLARALARPSNVLVLDEPTNDLDLETLDLLQEMLTDYPGTLLLVSHDRDFLDRIATSVVAFEGEGRWQEYAGGYSDMVAQRGFGVTALGVAKPAAPAAPRVPRPEPERAKARQKLTFADQHALRTLPAQIEKLTAEIARLEASLTDPELYRRDPKKFASTGETLEKLRTQLSDAESEWLRIEMLREEIEAAR